MAEVVITLALKRKSGILAAAVSAVNRAGLQFGSHQFVELDSGHGIQLNAESEDGWNDPGSVANELAGIRGVDQVLDIELDGRSLLGGADEPEAELQVAPADKSEKTGPEARQPAVAGSNSATRPSPQKPAAGQVPVHEPAPSTPPQAADARPPAEDKPLPAGASTSMRPSMIRRRRRRR
ncbi:MAG TPA: hypothetical protein VK036_07605 [Wenzhouxiangella sp.]|nr:hypothetical protein [Wenzhouxiangella sp.]